MLAVGQATRATKRAAGAKKTARRRQGSGGRAYLPAEASAKAGALFDIVNRSVRSPRDHARSANPSSDMPRARALAVGQRAPIGPGRGRALLILAKRSHVAEAQ